MTFSKQYVKSIKADIETVKIFKNKQTCKPRVNINIAQIVGNFF